MHKTTQGPRAPIEAPDMPPTDAPTPRTRATIERILWTVHALGRAEEMPGPVLQRESLDALLRDR